MSYGYLHLAKIINYDVIKGGYYLESVALARTSKWGPCPSLTPGLQPGDRVVLGATGTSRDNLIILGKVGADFPDISDIPGLLDQLNARKQPVRLATTANHGLTGLADIDGVTPLAGNRVLVKNQSSGSANGIYITAAGAWSRAADFAAGSAQYPGIVVYVTEGTANGDKEFGLTSDTVVTVGTTSHTWGRLTVDYTASNGVQLVGSDFRANYAQVMQRKVALGFVPTTGVDVTINHAFDLANKSDFLCEVTLDSTGEKVRCGVRGSDVNNVILSFETTPTTNQYRYQIQGLS